MSNNFFVAASMPRVRGKEKFYVITCGRWVGITRSYFFLRSKVDGIEGAVYRKYASYKSAQLSYLRSPAYRLVPPLPSPMVARPMQGYNCIHCLATINKIKKIYGLLAVLKLTGKKKKKDDMLLVVSELLVISF